MVSPLTQDRSVIVSNIDTHTQLPSRSILLHTQNIYTLYLHFDEEQVVINGMQYFVYGFYFSIIKLENLEKCDAGLRRNALQMACKANA